MFCIDINKKTASKFPTQMMLQLYTCGHHPPPFFVTADPQCCVPLHRGITKRQNKRKLDNVRREAHRQTELFSPGR